MIRLWYDQNGAVLGTPWKLEINGCMPFLVTEVRLRSSYTVFRTSEAPNGVLESAEEELWIDGALRQVSEFGRAHIGPPQCRCIDGNHEHGHRPGESE